MKPDDDLLQRYREANEHDPTRPGPALRENVLAQARTAATQTRPAANDTAWRWRALGGLAVLGLATLGVLQFDRGEPEEREVALGEATAPARATMPEEAQATDQARDSVREAAPAALSARRASPAPQATEAPSPSSTLLAAASRGATADAREALAQGADVNGADALGRTALMIAAQRGDAALVRLLLDAGADTRRTDHDGLRAIDLAQQAGHTDLLPALQERAPR